MPFSRSEQSCLRGAPATTLLLLAVSGSVIESCRNGDDAALFGRASGPEVASVGMAGTSRDTQRPQRKIAEPAVAAMPGGAIREEMP